MADNQMKDIYGTCPECNKPKIDYVWCGTNTCKKPHPRPHWTSDNLAIDIFIKKSQRIVKNFDDRFLEWIPFDRLENVIPLQDDKDTGSYLATWVDGPRYFVMRQRGIPSKVVLKTLGVSESITDSYLNELAEEYPSILRKDNRTIYGFTLDTKTQEYRLIIHIDYDELKSIYGLCPTCLNPKMDPVWCMARTCLEPHTGDEWTTGSDALDEFIRSTQNNAVVWEDTFLEWIPFQHLEFTQLLENEYGSTAYGGVWVYGKRDCQYYRHKARERHTRVTLNQLPSLGQEVIDELCKTHPCITRKDNTSIFGFTRNPATRENYIIYASDYTLRRNMYGLCSTCKQPKNDPVWCRTEACKMPQSNEQSTSGSIALDKFVTGTQRNVTERTDNFLEWIPADRLSDIQRAGEGFYSCVYTATWSTDERIGRNLPSQVLLKRLKGTNKNSDDFVVELERHFNLYQEYKGLVRIYGLTADPETGEYAIVMQQAKHGSLATHLHNTDCIQGWSRLHLLQDLAKHLKVIHKAGLFHGNLHSGNVLYDSTLLIADLGLCVPVEPPEINSVYGVIPYMAPEILRGELHTPAADVYSFGILMYEVATGKPPFYDCAHDRSLAEQICNGYRLELPEETPTLYVELFQMCCDARPENRPTAEKIAEMLEAWSNIYNEPEVHKSDDDKSREKLVLHEEAVYTSRLIEFANLPQPKNSPTTLAILENAYSISDTNSMEIPMSTPYDINDVNDHISNSIFEVEVRDG